jgi:uncharacterized C2H2 Zn-finger protein
MPSVSNGISPLSQGTGIHETRDDKSDSNLDGNSQTHEKNPSLEVGLFQCEECDISYKYCSSYIAHCQREHGEDEGVNEKVKAISKGSSIGTVVLNHPSDDDNLDAELRTILQPLEERPVKHPFNANGKESQKSKEAESLPLGSQEVRKRGRPRKIPIDVNLGTTSNPRKRKLHVEEVIPIPWKGRRRPRKYYSAPTRFQVICG